MERIGSRVHATGSELGFSLDRPFYWKIGTGLLYAEMPFNAAVRPPLLSDWESERVARFRNAQRRSAWLAGRALAKALVRERYGLKGIVEIREGADGEPLVYRAGLPAPDIWIGISCRGGRVAAVVGDRPVSLDIRQCDGRDVHVGERILDRAELRAMRRIFRANDVAIAVARAIKEASLRAVRGNVGGSGNLASVNIDGEFNVTFEGSHHSRNLHVFAVRVLEDVVVTVVGKREDEERQVTRIVSDGEHAHIEPAALQSVLERSVVRARRMTEARSRWHRLRWQGI